MKMHRFLVTALVPEWTNPNADELKQYIDDYIIGDLDGEMSVVEPLDVTSSSPNEQIDAAERAIDLAKALIHDLMPPPVGTPPKKSTHLRLVEDHQNEQED